MRATLIRRAGIQFPFLYAPNNVPKWQRIHQAKEGGRQWQRGPRAKYILYPYYTVMYISTACTMYMMTRKVLGHNTWW